MMNIVVPLQLGVRDMAFPTLNSVGLWLTASGIALMNISLAVGEFATTGWVAYPPLSELQFSPGVGVDYYLWALQISGIGTLLTGINFVTTILKTRAPGMSLMKMPVFCWTTLASNVLIVAAFPVLTATFAMLLLDRYLGFHFFSIDAGGNPMMYVNLFWVWGHPSLHPDPACVRRLLRGCRDVLRQAAFTLPLMVPRHDGDLRPSFLVWLHHFFPGRERQRQPGFFGVMTMVIAVPTGVRSTTGSSPCTAAASFHARPLDPRLHGDVRIGGMTGVLMAVPPADFQLHNSVFLVAHFHNVIIGGVVFPASWPASNIGSRRYSASSRSAGGDAFWCWFVGFFLAFAPLYVLSLMGMTGGCNFSTAWQTWLVVAALGAVVILAGIVCQAVQLVVSIRDRQPQPGLDRRPWNGRTLE
jgi:cytochrome o ubiquinol oxidase subunit 1